MLGRGGAEEIPVEQFGVGSSMHGAHLREKEGCCQGVRGSGVWCCARNGSWRVLYSSAILATSTGVPPSLPDGTSAPLATT